MVPLILGSPHTVFNRLLMGWDRTQRVWAVESGCQVCVCVCVWHSWIASEDSGFRVGSYPGHAC